MLDKSIPTPTELIARDEAPAPPPVVRNFVPISQPPATVSPKPKPRRLSLGEELFCRAYIANRGNASDAVRQVWPETSDPSKRGGRLVKRLRWRIRELTDRVVGQHELDAEGVLRDIASIASRDDGTVSVADRLRALEMLSKLYGLDKHSVQSAPSVAVQINLGTPPAEMGVASESDPIHAEKL